MREASSPTVSTMVRELGDVDMAMAAEGAGELGATCDSGLEPGAGKSRREAMGMM